METQLIMYIIGFSILGLLLFMALAYIIAMTIEYTTKAHFAAKLTYKLMLEAKMQERSADTFLSAMKQHADKVKKSD